MFFTQEDYKKIQKWLLLNSVKDTEFKDSSEPFDGDETIAFVQRGRNVKAPLKDLIDQFLLLGVKDFLNISTQYKENYISLSKAIMLIPFKRRKIGQVITFLNEDGIWEIYQFKGTNVNQWNNITLWENVLSSIIESNLGPDEEDLTSFKDGSKVKLKFKDKDYDKDIFSGLGRVYLRKNIVKAIEPSTGKPFYTNLLTNQMINKPNTIYIIQYDFDLNGEEITIPENCVLDFQGGKIVGNGKVVFSNTKFDGILKLSDGFADSIVLEGTYEEGQVLMVEDRLKYWKDNKWNNVADDTNFTVKSTETLPAGQPAEVILTTVEDITAFSFKIPRGLTGERGAPGINGESILSSRTIFAFKVSSTQPTSPVGGSWNSVTDVVTYPAGWSANDSSAGIVWMSTAIFGTTGIRGTWSTPIRITGNDGKNGEDGNFVEFIYRLTKDSSVKPGKPISQDINDHVPLGWTDNPVGIDLTNKAEWVCTREKDTVWGEWSEPALWSKYGVDGRDGDGVEYIFKLTSAAIPPERPTSIEQTTDFIPVGWTDNPVGVSASNNYEWVSVRKFRNNLWGSFSNPALWAKYGENGSDGVDGLSVRMMYAKTTDSSTPPHFVNNHINPGSTWALAIPNYSGNEAIWAIQGTVTTSNILVGTWQGPYLVTGVNGKDGTPVNYKTYVYKLSEIKPNKPVSNDPVNPGNSWVDYPNTAGNWWQCVGSVNGYTNLVISWGEVIPLNGRDGTAQDGKFTEFRFAKSSSSSAPAINVSLRTPSGWTKEFPTISGAETLWMTKAEVNPDDTLLGTWSQPVRISGEKGPQGNTGPAGEPGTIGSQGPSGVPGIDIELRFSLGSDAVQDATWSEAVKRNREPSSSGWLKAMPTVTEAKPYIWMIQSRITRVNPSDPGVLESGNWSDPIRLNGTNGLPGATGKKGQLVYPAGVYGNNVRYTTTDTKAPYVYDPSDGNFYVLNAIMTWEGSEQNNKTPSQSYAESQGSYWLRFDAYEAIYAKIGIIANGLVGSAVFNGDYMFSQQGTNASGEESSNYDEFGTDNFSPNFQINFRTGEIQAKKGSISNGLTSQWTILQMSKDYTQKVTNSNRTTAKFNIDPSNLTTNNLLLVDNWSNVSDASDIKWTIEVYLPRDTKYIGTTLNIKFVILGVPSSLTFSQIQFEITNLGAYTFTLGRKTYNSVTTFNEQAVTLLAEPYISGDGTTDPTAVNRCIWRVISTGFKGGAGVISADSSI